MKCTEDLNANEWFILQLIYDGGDDDTRVTLRADQRADKTTEDHQYTDIGRSENLIEFTRILAGVIITRMGLREFQSENVNGFSVWVASGLLGLYTERGLAVGLSGNRTTRRELVSLRRSDTTSFVAVATGRDDSVPLVRPSE